MSDEHSSFIKTPKQLIVVVVLAFAVPIALIVLLSQLVTGVRPGATERERPGRASVARITHVAAVMGLSGMLVMGCSLDYPHHRSGLQMTDAGCGRHAGASRHPRL